MPPRLDPTLENELITRVKTDQDSNALTALAHQYSGVYFNVVNRYAQAYPNVVKAPDLANDQLYNLYRFVNDFDVERSTKLSTYIHYRTNCLCKGMLRTDRRDPLSGALGLASGVPPSDQDTYRQGGVYYEENLVDETEDVVEHADYDLKIEDVMETARRVCPDSRFISILQYRHFNTIGPATSLSWRQIGRVLGCSHETCRKIYATNLALVKQEIAKRMTLTT